MSAFWSGFEKRAELFRTIAKNVKVVGKRGDPAVAQKALGKLIFHQRPIKAMMGVLPKEVRNAAREGVADKMRGFTIGGTIAHGAKGNRSYIAREMFTDPALRSKLLSPRGVVNHEAFHANAPLGLGNSEILAHAYGGLKHKKGTHDLGKAVQQVGHLFKVRPVRGAIEAGTAAAGTYGAAKGVGAIRNKVKEKPE